MTTEPPSVLVVEDDDDLREMIVDSIQLVGIDAEGAANGAEALVSMDSHMPSLILLDMKMPVMDGWEFSRALATRTGPRPPVLVMTAAPDPAERAADVGAVGWVAKPFDLDHLLGSVQKLVAQGRE
jgi:CheY-like chemotaxis protein